jgi:hypothetical protein
MAINIQQFLIQNDHFDEALDVTNDSEELPSPERKTSPKVGNHHIFLM